MTPERKAALREDAALYTDALTTRRAGELLTEALDALDEAESQADATLVWADSDDRDDEWTDAVHAAFPTRSGSHPTYATAMRMVGNRYSKGALVALVNWLLVEREKLAAHILQQSAAVPTVWDHSCRQCVSCAGIDAERIVDGFGCGWHLAQRIAKGGA